MHLFLVLTNENEKTSIRLTNELKKISPQIFKHQNNLQLQPMPLWKETCVQLLMIQQEQENRLL